MARSAPRLAPLALAAIATAALAASCAGVPGPPPPGMVWIPPGEFTMGTDDPRSLANERPAHRVRLDGFWMDATDVTNAEFRRFVEATGYVTTAERPVDWDEMKKQVPEGTPKPPDEMLHPGSLVFKPPSHEVDLRDMSGWWSWTLGASWKHPQGPGSSIEGRDDDPVTQVSWFDAVAYTKWAGKRLPTEAEWEYAARGGAKTTTRYWWGDEFRPGGKFMTNTFTGDFPYRNTSEDGFERVAPVRSFPANGYGLYDMAGNVWNWCADNYRPDAHVLLAQAGGVAVNPKGPDAPYDPVNPLPASPVRVTKGGSFLCNASYCESYRPVSRRGTPPDTSLEHIGFRCVSTGRPKP